MVSFKPTSASSTSATVRPLRARPSAPPAMTWPIFDGLGLDAVITTRAGGVSRGRYTSLNLGLHVGDDPEAVLSNRRRAAATVGGTIDDLVFCQQVHGSQAAVVTGRDRGRGATSSSDAIAGADALITSVAGPVLVIMVADCVPLVLFDPVRRIVACVHAGWGGTVRAVTSAVVERLAGLGSDPADLVVGIGPSISPQRYQVGADVAEAVGTAFGPRAPELIRPAGTGAWTFDLWQANLIQLTSAGVPASRIQLAGLDTGPQTPFFSHRSEGPTGRFAVLARLTEARDSEETQQ